MDESKEPFPDLHLNQHIFYKQVSNELATSERRRGQRVFDRKLLLLSTASAAQLVECLQILFIVLLAAGCGFWWSGGGHALRAISLGSRYSALHRALRATGCRGRDPREATSGDCDCRAVPCLLHYAPRVHSLNHH